MGVEEPLLNGDSDERGGTGERDAKSLDQTPQPGESSEQERKSSDHLTHRGSHRPPRDGPVRRIFGRLLHPIRPSSGHELRRFQRWQFVLGLDQSTKIRLSCSWIIFLLATVGVPLMSWVYVSCKGCDDDHSHPFQPLVDFSESMLAAVSFLCLTNIVGKYGMRSVLLLDKLADESMLVRYGYEAELQNSFKWLAYILIPCAVAELVHKVWWYLYVSVEIPFLAHDPAVKVLFCSATLLAWVYKSSVFLFVCLLFRLMCALQLLRLEDYLNLLKDTFEVSIILKEHMRIRDQLLMISHRYRIFLILSMFAITFSQLTSLFLVTDSSNPINFFRGGDLVVCSIVQLSGFVLCLHGAAKITHRAQRIMSIVSQWHAVASCSPSMVSFSNDRSAPSHFIGPAHPLVYNHSQSDFENINPVSWRITSEVAHDVEAYHQRQALMKYLKFARAGVSLYGFTLDRMFLSSLFDIPFTLTTLEYLQFANAGISVYGFVLDRGFLFAVFGLEFSLSLFILGKTILTSR